MDSFIFIYFFYLYDYLFISAVSVVFGYGYFFAYAGHSETVFVLHEWDAVRANPVDSPFPRASGIMQRESQVLFLPGLIGREAGTYLHLNLDCFSILYRVQSKR